MTDNRRKELQKLLINFKLLKDSKKTNWVRDCVQFLDIIGLSLLTATVVLSWAFSQVATLGGTVKRTHVEK